MLMRFKNKKLCKFLAQFEQEFQCLDLTDMTRWRPRTFKDAGELSRTSLGNGQCQLVDRYPVCNSQGVDALIRRLSSE